MKKKKFKVVLATDRKGRELQTLSNICGEKGIPFHFFDVRHDVVKDHVHDNTVVFTRGPCKNRLGYLNKLTEMEMLGATMVNNRETQEVCNDKWRCHMMLEQIGLTQPKTVMIASSRDDIIEKQFTKLGLEFPVVVKKLEGSYGIGIMIADTMLGLKTIIQTLYKEEAVHQSGDDVIIQEFVEHKHDYRAHVLDGQVIAAMKRTPQEGDFRSNVSRGASVKSVDLSDIEKQHCIMAATQVNARWCAVDFIRSDKENSPIILEVNHAPHTQGIEEAMRDDGAEVDAPLMTQIVEHFERLANE